MPAALVLTSACAAASAPGTPATRRVDGGPSGPADTRVPMMPNPPLGRAEVCDNGLDDEGNGVVDDGCPCTPGATQVCYLGAPSQADVGICRRGTQTCQPSGEFGLWNPCTGSIGPAVETCDMLDNDCDGAIDDDAGCMRPNPPSPTASCGAPTDVTPNFRGDSRSVRGTTCGGTDVVTLDCNRVLGAPDAFFTWNSPNEVYQVTWTVTPGFGAALAQADSPCSPGAYFCENFDDADYAHPHTLVVEKSDGTCGEFTLTVTRTY